MKIDEFIFDAEFSQEPEMRRISEYEFQTDDFKIVFKKMTGNVIVSRVDENESSDYNIMNIKNIPSWLVLDGSSFKELFRALFSFTKELLYAFEEYSFPNSLNGLDLDFDNIDKARLKYILNMRIPGWRKISLIGGIIRFVSDPPLNFLDHVSESKSFRKNVVKTDESMYLGLFPDVSELFSISNLRIERMNFQEFTRFIKGLNVIFDTQILSDSKELKKEWINKFENIEKSNHSMIQFLKADEQLAYNIPEEVQEARRQRNKPRTPKTSQKLIHARRSVFGSSLNIENNSDDTIIASDEIFEQEETIESEKSSGKVNQLDDSLYASFDKELFVFIKEQDNSEKITNELLTSIREFQLEIIYDREIIPVECLSKKNFVHYYRNISSDSNIQFKQQFCRRVLEGTKFIKNDDHSFPVFTYAMRFLNKEESYEFSNIFVRGESFIISQEKENVEATIYFFLKYKEKPEFDEFVEYFVSSNLYKIIGEENIFNSVEEYFEEEKVPLQMILSLNGIELQYA